MSIQSDLILFVEAPFFTPDLQAVLIIDGNSKTSTGDGWALACTFAT